MELPNVKNRKIRTVEKSPLHSSIAFLIRVGDNYEIAKNLMNSLLLVEALGSKHTQAVGSFCFNGIVAYISLRRDTGVEWH